jgi:Rod binding domain-containing protein
MNIQLQTTKSIIPTNPTTSKQKIVKATAKNDPKEVGQQFEAFFYRMMLKEMRKSDSEDSFFDSTNYQQIQELQDDELASVLGSKGRLGISNMISDYLNKESSPNIKSASDLKQSLGLIKPTNKELAL